MEKHTHIYLNGVKRTQCAFVLTFEKNWWNRNNLIKLSYNFLTIFFSKAIFIILVYFFIFLSFNHNFVAFTSSINCVYLIKKDPPSLCLSIKVIFMFFHSYSIMKTSSLNLNLKLNYFILYRSKFRVLRRWEWQTTKKTIVPSVLKIYFNPLMMPYDEDFLLFNLKKRRNFGRVFWWKWILCCCCCWCCCCYSLCLFWEGERLFDYEWKYIIK